MHPQRIPGPSPHADRVLGPPLLPKPAIAFSDFLRKGYRFFMDVPAVDLRLRARPLSDGQQLPRQAYRLVKLQQPHVQTLPARALQKERWLRVPYEYNLFPPPSSLPSAFFRFVLTGGNRRKMPKCKFYVRNGYCSNGEECL